MKESDCDCEADNSIPSPSEYPHRLHKFIKKSLHRIYYPGKCECGGQEGKRNTVGPQSNTTLEDGQSTRVSSFDRPGCECRNHPTTHGLHEHSSSSIFERSLESNSHFIISNRETPLHYSIENYVSPILDTTTEILSDPKVDFKDVKLNCYCEDEPRPRSRSIISMSLINSLDSGKDDRLDRTDDRIQNDASLKQLNKEKSHEHRASKDDSKESIGSSKPNFRSQVSSNKENQHPSRSSSNFDNLQSTLEQQTIEYYSFADMVNHETLSPHSSSSSIVDLGPTDITGYDINNLAQSTGEDGSVASPVISPRRRGSYTISVKDYIGA